MTPDINQLIIDVRNHRDQLTTMRDAIDKTIVEYNDFLQAAFAPPASELPEPKWRRDDDVCGARWIYKAEGSPDIAYVVQRGNSFGWNFYAHLASGEHRCDSADEAKRAVESAWNSLADYLNRTILGLPPKEEPLPTLTPCCGAVPQERGQYIVVCRTCGKAVVGKTRREAFEAWNAKEEPSPVLCGCAGVPPVITESDGRWEISCINRNCPRKIVYRGSRAEAAQVWNEMQAELAGKAVVKDSLTAQTPDPLAAAVVEAAEKWRDAQIEIDGHLAIGSDESITDSYGRGIAKAVMVARAVDAYRAAKGAR